MSTLFPQPWYQGPTKIIDLSERKFREDVQRRKQATVNEVGEGPRITEIKEDGQEEELSSSNSTKTTNRKKNKGKGKATTTTKEGKYTRYWIVMLYANWSLACLNFEAVLAKLSLEYSADHIKFGKYIIIIIIIIIITCRLLFLSDDINNRWLGKIDIDIYTDLADEYGISRDPASFDLPTLLLFRDGAQIRRLPELTPTTDDSNKSKNSAATAAKDTITRIGWSKKAVSIIIPLYYYY